MNGNSEKRLVHSGLAVPFFLLVFLFFSFYKHQPENKGLGQKPFYFRAAFNLTRRLRRKSLQQVMLSL